MGEGEYGRRAGKRRYEVVVLRSRKVNKRRYIRKFGRVEWLRVLCGH